MDYLTGENILIVLVALGAVSEALSIIPWFKSNGVFQAIKNGVGTLIGFFRKK